MIRQRVYRMRQQQIYAELEQWAPCIIFVVRIEYVLNYFSNKSFKE